MKNHRLLCFILYVCFLSQSLYAQQSSTQEFNEIFPVNEGVLAAINMVETIVPTSNHLSKSLRKSYISTLEQRAFACTQFASNEEVSSKQILPPNFKLKECLKNQDDRIVQVIGLSLVSYRANQLPLRPFSKIETQFLIQNPKGKDIHTGTTASKANVAVLKLTNGEYVSYELPSGKKLADLPKMPDASDWSVKLSPNGRVMALLNRGLSFIDNETGKELWKVKESSDFYLWLPELGAALISWRDGNNTKLVLLDFKTGEILPFPIPYTNQSWALNISESPSRFLIASNGSFDLIENIRTKNGIESKVIQTYSLAKANVSGFPIAMQNGKSIFFTAASAQGNVLTLLNLDSGKEVQFDPGKFIDKNNYAKSSENDVLLQSYDNESNKSKLWDLNIAKSTYQPVRMPEFWGILYRSENRPGYMIRDNRGMWFGEKSSLEKVVPSVIPIGGLIEKPDCKSPYGSITSGQAKISKKQAILHAIGVYEGPQHFGGLPVDDPSPSTIEVRVHGKSHPVILALSNYEAVMWKIIPDADVVIKEIILSNAEGAKVIGIDESEVRVTRKTLPLLYDENKIKQSAQILREYTCLDISTYQALYKGSEFSVGP